MMQQFECDEAGELTECIGCKVDKGNNRARFLSPHCCKASQTSLTCPMEGFQACLRQKDKHLQPQKESDPTPLAREQRTCQTNYGTTASSPMIVLTALESKESDARVMLIPTCPTMHSSTWAKPPYSSWS
mmetsp:Transcript_40331/g.97343  ORF Transcript_40331/g.97343 Transcript_40331/m.97343 type:complete len:130 (+) Transcript_40331:968-1357(+)